MCLTAFGVAEKPAEKRLILDVLKRYPSVEAFKLAVRARQDPDVADEASEAMFAIAKGLGASADDLSELLAGNGIAKVNLEIVKAEYGAGDVQVDVTKQLQKSLGETPWITLPSTSYNESFGGDPVPGTKKQLRVQYRLDGKSGEATFDENAVIFLRRPK